MALTTNKYQWYGLELAPYAKIVSKTITEYFEDGKKYQAEYEVIIYTTYTKEGIVKQETFIAKDVQEDVTLEALYLNLKTQVAFRDWADA